MKRREFILSLGGAAVASSLSFNVSAQQGARMPRVGVLWHASRAEEEKGPLIMFRRALKAVGYVEAENIAVEHRFPNEEPALFKQFAEELAALKPDVLATVTRPAAIAMAQATTTIPIVFIVVPDPIGSHLIDNLARPQG